MDRPPPPPPPPMRPLPPDYVEVGLDGLALVIMIATMSVIPIVLVVLAISKHWLR